MAQNQPKHNENLDQDIGKPEEPAQMPQMVRCAVIPEQIYIAWLDAFRDNPMPPKMSQPILEGLKTVQMAEFPIGQPK